VEDNVLIVYWEKSILVVLDIPSLKKDKGLKVSWDFPHLILDWYAEQYSFERKKLTGQFVSCVRGPLTDGN
jgi:hypothetical protein